MYTLDHVDRNAVFSELIAPNQDHDWREENVATLEMQIN